MDINTKPLIAVVPNLDRNKLDMVCNSVTKTYTDAVIKGGGVPFILPLTTDRELTHRLLSMAGGALFVGGMDVDPARYGEKPIADLMSVTPELDEVQFMMAEEAIGMDKPILAICRGSQVINVALGGTLVQDVPTTYPESDLVHMPEPLRVSIENDHEVVAEEGSVLHKLFGEQFPVNSIHHQSVKEPGNGLEVTARATDGVIEATEHESKPILTIQWHPEAMLMKDDAMLPLFEHFIGMCKKASIQ